MLDSASDLAVISAKTSTMTASTRLTTNWGRKAPSPWLLAIRPAAVADTMIAVVLRVRIAVR